MAIGEKIDTLRRITKIKQNEAIRREFRPYFILKLCLHIANFTTFFVILRRVSVFSTIAIVKLFVNEFGTHRVTFPGAETLILGNEHSTRQNRAYEPRTPEIKLNKRFH